MAREDGPPMTLDDGSHRIRANYWEEQWISWEKSGQVNAAYNLNISVPAPYEITVDQAKSAIVGTIESFPLLLSQTTEVDGHTYFTLPAHSPIGHETATWRPQ